MMNDCFKYLSIMDDCLHDHKKFLVALLMYTLVNKYDFDFDYSFVPTMSNSLSWSLLLTQAEDEPHEGRGKEGREDGGVSSSTSSSSLGHAFSHPLGRDNLQLLPLSPMLGIPEPYSEFLNRYALFKK
jgi:hypothetical protein